MTIEQYSELEYYEEERRNQKPRTRSHSSPCLSFPPSTPSENNSKAILPNIIRMCEAVD